MKPVIIKVSKDALGREFVTLTLEEFEAAIDGAYDAGVIDGRRQVEEAMAAAEIINKEQEIRILPL